MIVILQISSADRSFFQFIDFPASNFPAGSKAKQRAACSSEKLVVTKPELQAEWILDWTKFKLASFPLPQSGQKMSCCRFEISAESMTID